MYIYIYICMCNNMKVRIYFNKYKDLYNKGINQ